MKKKLLALFVSVLFVLSAFASAVALAEEVVDAGYTYDAETDTYTVTTADGYIAVVNLMNGTSPETANLDATIKLAADLDFTDKVVPALAPAVANGYFSGTFDGNGYKMSNITMSGATRTAIVANGLACTFVDLTVTDSTFSGAAYTSVLLGDTPKNGDQKLNEVVSKDDVVTFENCHILRCSVTSSANYATLFATTGDNKLLVKDCTALDCFVESKQSGGRAAFIAQDRGACTNIDVVNFVATGTAKATSGNGVAGIMGYVCGTTITMTNVYSAIDCGTAKWAGQFVPADRYCNVIISDSICVGDPLGHVYDLGNSGYGDVILTNVVVVAEEGETAPIFGVDVVIASNSDRVALIVDGVVLDGDKDHEPEKDIADAAAAATTWMATTVPTVKPADAITQVRSIFANNIAMRRLAVKAIGGEFDFAETNGYEYNAETNTYTVYDANGLNAVVADIKAVDNAVDPAKHVDDANIVLVADIDMKDATNKWDPICNYANGVYVGTIDGQGHTIYNFTDINTAHRRGLISRAGACTVKNITFVDPVVTGGKNNAFIVADIFGGNAGETVTIENCNIINGTITSTGSYIGALIGCGTKALDVVIKDCVVDADVVGTDHVGLLIGGESAAIVDPVATYTIEGVVASGTVTGVKNAGMTGYFCDINVNVKNVVSTVKAIGTTETTNTSSLMANAKRCNVTLENVITEGALVASAEDLKAHAFVLKNVTVLGTEAAPVFKSFTIGDGGAPTLTIDGEAAELATATAKAVTTGLAHLNVNTVIFADNATLRDAAFALIAHEHVFDQTVVADAYLNSAATCTAKATYFYSCDCTAAGTETFEVGEMLPHTLGKGYQNDGENHYATCTECEAKVYFDHVYDQEIAGDEYLVSDATCTTGAVFYKSCECGLKGEETFMSIGSLGHLFGEWTTVTEPTVDAEGVKERECSVCGEKETKSIEKLPVTEAPVVEEPTFTEKVLGKVNSVKDWTVAKAIAVKNKAAGALGCGGSIGGTSIIIMLAAAGAVIARKKED